jgi:hypothetical protein
MSNRNLLGKKGYVVVVVVVVHEQSHLLLKLVCFNLFVGS